MHLAVDALGVAPHQALGPFGVAGQQRLQDIHVLLVVVDQVPPGLDGAHEALGEVHDAVHDQAVEGIAAGAGDQAMEAGVQGHPLVVAVGGAVLLQHPADFLEMVIAGVQGGQAADLRLQVGAHLVEVGHRHPAQADQVGQVVAQAQAGGVAHEGPTLDAPADLHEARGLQGAQGLAHHRAAHAQLGGQLHLAGQGLARVVAPGDDRLLQRVDHALVKAGHLFDFLEIARHAPSAVKRYYSRRRPQEPSPMARLGLGKIPNPD